ncbi:MAG: hypothetical protein LVR00_09850 [Rhabdochlamydiaceae bacterium]|jgi:hypothetical protein
MAMVTLPYPSNVEFVDHSAIQAAVAASPDIQTTVARITELYHTVNIAEVMFKLNQTGSLLRLAFAGTQGFGCSSTVVDIMTTYQHLVADSLTTSQEFRMSSLRALREHQMALMFMEKHIDDAVNKAMQKLMSTAELAKTMAEKSGQLVVESQALSLKADLALKEIQTNHTNTKQDQDRIGEIIGELVAEEAYQKGRKTSLEKEVEGERTRELEAGKDSARTRTIGSIIKIISMLMSPIVAPLYAALPAGSFPTPDNAEEQRMLQERETQIASRRADREAELRDTNASLARSVALLATTNIETDQLGVAVRALEVARKSMGRITTIFMDVRLFWQNVESHCRELANIEHLQDGAVLAEAGMETAFTNAIKASGLGWLSLGKISHEAVLAITEAHKQYGETMSTLPTKAECVQLMAETPRQILEQLEAEKQRIA